MNRSALFTACALGCFVMGAIDSPVTRLLASDVNETIVCCSQLPPERVLVSDRAIIEEGNFLSVGRSLSRKKRIPVIEVLKPSVHCYLHSGANCAAAGVIGANCNKWFRCWPLSINPGEGLPAKRACKFIGGGLAAIFDMKSENDGTDLDGVQLVGYHDISALGPLIGFSGIIKCIAHRFPLQETDKDQQGGNHGQQFVSFWERFFICCVCIMGGSLLLDHAKPHSVRRACAFVLVFGGLALWWLTGFCPASWDWPL